jgi:hypothetical protein
MPTRFLYCLRPNGQRRKNKHGPTSVAIHLPRPFKLLASLAQAGVLEQSCAAKSAGPGNALALPRPEMIAHRGRIESVLVRSTLSSG